MRKIIIGIGWFVSIFCLYIFFRNNDLTEMIGVFKQANYFYFIPIVAVYLFGYVTRAWRWYFLIRTIKKVPFFRLFSVLVIGFMANNILPLRMGEVARAYLFGKKEEISKSASLATIMIERLFDGLTILLYCGLSSAFLTVAGASIVNPVLFGGVLLLFLCVLTLCLGLLFFREGSLAVAEKIFRVLPKGFGTKTHTFLDRFIDGLAVLKNPGDLLAVTFLSLLSWGIEGFAYYLIAMAFNIPLNLPMIFLLMSVVNLAMLAPSTPGGLGLFEASGLAMLVLFSVEKIIARSYIIAVHGVVLFPIIILGLFFLWKDHLSLKEIKEA